MKQFVKKTQEGLFYLGRVRTLTLSTFSSSYRWTFGTVIISRLKHIRKIKTHKLKQFCIILFKVYE